MELSPQCLNCLLSHDWPSNVRELRIFLERAAVFAVGNTIRPDTDVGEAQRFGICPVGALIRCQRSEQVLPAMPERVASVPTGLPVAETTAALRWLTLAQLEHDHIQRTLEHTGYNQRAAADLLGIHRQQLLRKIKKHDLNTSSSRPGRPSKRRVP
jgi:DNA-binding NtrC family response regulator